LKSLWIFDNNKKLKEPFLIKSIAVISVRTWKWYNDFKTIIEKSWYPIQFVLFEASMQWKNVPKSIIFQLEKIKKFKHLFDIVVIIRGGGADTELVEFDDFELLEELFKLLEKNFIIEKVSLKDKNSYKVLNSINYFVKIVESV